MKRCNRLIFVGSAAVIAACNYLTASPPVFSVSRADCRATPRSAPQAVAKPVNVPDASAAPVGAILITDSEDQQGLMAYAVDPHTLQDVPNYAPINFGHHYQHIFSLDGRLWAVISDGELRTVDLTTWKATPTTHRFEGFVPAATFGYEQLVPAMTFNPETTLLAVAEIHWLEDTPEGRIWLIDPNGAWPARPIPLDIFPRQIQFSPDGTTLIIYGNGRGLASPRVASIDVTSGNTVWSVVLEGVRDEYGVQVYRPGLAFSADGHWLYVVHPDADCLTVVDLTKGSATTLAITPPLSVFDRLMRLTSTPAYAKGPMEGVEKMAALSPDGTRLYISGVRRERRPTGSRRYDPLEIPLGLQMVDPRTGTRVAKLDTLITNVSISPDGRWLYVSRPAVKAQSEDRQTSSYLPTAVQVLDAMTLELVAHWAGASYVQGGFTPDQAAIWAERAGSVRVGVSATLEGIELGPPSVVDRAVPMTFAPDGALLSLVWERDHPTATIIQLVDSSSGKLLATREVPGRGGKLILPARLPWP